MHGFFLAIAGILLLIPGFVTDAIGAALLIPPLRLLLGRLIISRMTLVGGFPGSKHPAAGGYRDSPVVEGEFTEETGPADTPDLIEGEILPPTDRDRHNGS